LIAGSEVSVALSSRSFGKDLKGRLDWLADLLENQVLRVGDGKKSGASLVC
jgi:hypothetical protein